MEEQKKPSKIIMYGVLGIIAFGFIVYLALQAQHTVGIEIIVPQVKAGEPEKIVGDFYRWYTDPKTKRSFDVARFFAPGATSSIAGTIISTGVDPVLCGGDIPGRIEVKKAVVKGDQSTVRVFMNINGGISTVSLKKIDDSWKIIGFVCSK